MDVKMVEIFTTDMVEKIMVGANRKYIKRYWPIVFMALDESDLDYKEMILMALGTIAAETGNFNIRIREYVSKWNTTPEGRRNDHLFDKYDDRSDLGNAGRPDGYEYRGGGAIQLTGRYNYRHIGMKLNLPLEDKPELIENPIVSARALALFLQDKKMQINKALSENNLRQARRLVNGGSHGLERFQDTYYRGERLIKEMV